MYCRLQAAATLPGGLGAQYEYFSAQVEVKKFDQARSNWIDSLTLGLFRSFRPLMGALKCFWSPGILFLNLENQSIRSHLVELART